MLSIKQWFGLEDEFGGLKLLRLLTTETEAVSFAFSPMGIGLFVWRRAKLQDAWVVRTDAYHLVGVS